MLSIFAKFELRAADFVNYKESDLVMASNSIMKKKIVSLVEHIPPPLKIDMHFYLEDFFKYLFSRFNPPSIDIKYCSKISILNKGICYDSISRVKITSA